MILGDWERKKAIIADCEQISRQEKHHRKRRQQIKENRSKTPKNLIFLDFFAFDSNQSCADWEKEVNVEVASVDCGSRLLPRLLLPVLPPLLLEDDRLVVLGGDVPGTGAGKQ